MAVSYTHLDVYKRQGEDYTFWGRGVSQGHSDAIRRIEGVADARQYTVPVASALEAVRNGEKPQLTTRQKHTRECFVVAEEGADLAAIEKAIVEMPNYFADYDTTVTFISQEELDRDHAGIPHGGSVFRSGVTGENGEHTHVVEYSLKLDSNPEFTGSVLVACARAAHRLSREGVVGCKTMFDICLLYTSMPCAMSSASPSARSRSTSMSTISVNSSLCINANAVAEPTNPHPTMATFRSLITRCIRFLPSTCSSENLLHPGEPVKVVHRLSVPKKG